MARSSILLVFVFVCFLFVDFQLIQAQTTVADNSMQQTKYERNLRAITSYVNDEVAYFEGFMLCDKYAEKKKLVADIETTVQMVEKLARQTDYQHHLEVAQWRAKAHFIQAMALGLLGDRKGADLALSEAYEPIPVDTTNLLFTFKSEEVRIGSRNRQLNELEREQQTHLNDLARVDMTIDPDQRLELGTNLTLRLTNQSRVTHPQHLPFVVAFAEDRINSALIKEAKRETLYLPPGKYVIIKPDKNTIVTKFEINSPTKAYSFHLPAKKFPTKYFLFGLGAATLVALGYFLL